MVWIAIVCAGAFAAAPACATPPPGLAAELALLRKGELPGERVATLLAGLAAADAPAVLAEAHMLRCQQLAGTDASEELRHATEGFTALGELPAPAVRSGLHLCRGYATERLQSSAQALDDYEAAIAIGTGHAPAERLAMAQVLRGEALYVRGDFAAALRDMQAAYATFVAEGSGAMQRYALNAIANLYSDVRVGELEEALATYRTLHAAHVASAKPAEAATALFNIASTLDRMGRREEAVTTFREAISAFQALGDAVSVAETQRALASSLAQAGAAAEALPLVEAAARHARDTGAEGLAAQVALTHGLVLNRLGRHEEALERIDAARARFAPADNPRFLEVIERERAQALAAQGQWEQAYAARSAEVQHAARLARQLDANLPSRLRIQFEGELREQENRALARESALRASALQSEQRARRLQTLATGLASLLAAVLLLLAIRAVARARAMRRIALVDELTGLPNRRAIRAEAATLLERVRNGAPGSALLMDIDHFKRINDTLGHEVGDQVLVRVARALEQAIAGQGKVGRFGGEEFLAVVPGDLAAALAVAERLRAAVQAADWRAVDPALAVTTSVGAASFSPADTEVEDAVRAADAALYRAKESGRNRVKAARART